MKEAARLPRDCRETIIRLDHDTKEAFLWTQHRGIVGRCRRGGWVQEKAQAGGFWFRAPLRAILVRSGAGGVRKARGKGGFGAKKGILAKVEGGESQG